MKDLLKIPVTGLIPYFHGDEMAEIAANLVFDHLIYPFLGVTLDEHDLSLANREKTENKVVSEASEALIKHKYGLKVATITPNKDQVTLFNLSQRWPSPNGDIRKLIKGSIFRENILPQNLRPYIPHWTKPIVIARHPEGCQYDAIEMKTTGEGELKLLFEPLELSTLSLSKSTRSNGAAMLMYNSEASIKAYANTCFMLAIERKLPLYFGTKNTILKIYDEMFKTIFDELYLNEYKEQMDSLGIFYKHFLIDGLVAKMVVEPGGYIAAFKNLEGDIFSDWVGQVLGSIGMTTSQLISPDGKIRLFDAAHGTAPTLYEAYLQGGKTSFNSTATIFSWTGLLKYKAKLDKNETLSAFALGLEEAVLKTIEEGCFTGDIATQIVNPGDELHYATTEEFILGIKNNLLKKLIN